MTKDVNKKLGPSTWLGNRKKILNDIVNKHTYMLNSVQLFCTNKFHHNDTNIFHHNSK